MPHYTGNMKAHENKPHGGLRARLHEIVFEADTPSGRFFDLTVLTLIGASVLVVMLDSVAEFQAVYGPVFRVLEWGFTLIFTAEYLLRLSCVLRPLVYARSFYGLVDLVAILPSYLGLLFPGSEYLLVVRLLRVLRIFRILKLTEYFVAAEVIVASLKASQAKIRVFLFAVCTLSVVAGALMYLVEGPAHGFTSIPRSIYWAIVTLTTVGYGDIAPKTVLGQMLASVIMILGYGIIAVPTGIVTVEMVKLQQRSISTQACHACGAQGHDDDAKHCKYCGTAL